MHQAARALGNIKLRPPRAVGIIDVKRPRRLYHPDEQIVVFDEAPVGHLAAELQEHFSRPLLNRYAVC